MKRSMAIQRMCDGQALRAGLRWGLKAGLLAGLLAGCGDDVGLTPIADNSGLLGVSLGKVAVVTGDFDREEELLSQLQIEFTLYDGWITGPPAGAALAAEYARPLPTVEQLLSSADALETFDILFLNCGLRGTGEINPDSPAQADAHLIADADMIANLRDFVNEGGSLFVSDQAYYLIEAAFPELIEFHGDDGRPSEADVGGIATLTGTVVDEDLKTAISSNTVTLDFPVSHWTVLDQSQGVMVSGDVPVLTDNDTTELLTNRPLLIQAAVGAGMVTFTSFHNLLEVDQVRADLQVYVLRSLGRSR